ncbi:hypothetical protein IC575_019255 [Cucumis melo]|uniref:Uncharacterized protein n=1 Tax=Cucumis melo TaxID=3656 RepID=A0A9I9DVU4_CUCME
MSRKAKSLEFQTTSRRSKGGLQMPRDRDQVGNEENSKRKTLVEFSEKSIRCSAAMTRDASISHRGRRS